MRRYNVLITLCLAVVSCILLAGSSQAVINGTVANGLYTGVASLGDCSSVLVAPRVMLTSAHCRQSHALQCTTLGANPINVTFAEPGGGWADDVSFGNRTVAVQSFVQSPAIFDLSSCTSDDMFNCPNILRQNIDHSKELVVLYLADDAPADAVPLPILIHPGVDASQSAAEVGGFAGLASWVQGGPPVVTTVGYGIGSHSYTVDGDEVLGRDYGVQQLVATSSTFFGYLGADTCNSAAPVSNQPGVVASPEDLFLADIVDPLEVDPGAQFDAKHSHSGRGDSGGPVLLGQGAAAKGISPTALPPPGPGSGYNPSRQYIAGTASINVGSGQMLATAFNPTWTLSATNFLMAALHDSDGDRYADAVDDDRDGDGCNNQVDQHADDRYVEVGTVLHFNCNPPRTAILADESVDTDDDGLADCEDPNDDNDKLFDFEDPCPLTESELCFQFGTVCSWNSQFFDCGLGGCNEIELKFSRLVNPDPTASVFFPVVSARQNVVVVAPAAGLSVEQSARVLAGGGNALFGQTTELFLLEVVGPDGEIRGILIAYGPGDVSVANLGGANGLELRFGVPGVGLVVNGIRLPTGPPAPAPVLGEGGLAIAVLTLLLAAGFAIKRRRPAGEV